jgi:hypothetical protein
VNSSKLARLFVLVLLTGIAAWLRFTAIGFGLPEQFRPDEEMTVPTALGFDQDWNPHQAIYPAAQTYLIHGALRFHAITRGLGSDLHQAFALEDGWRAFLIARQLTAAMGTATVPIVYLAAAPVFGPTAAMVSAAIVAVSFIHQRESKFAKVEAPAGFWLALSILMMLRIVSRGHWSDYAFAGLFCGLAAATHYTSGAISIGILVAHHEARRREGKPLLTALLDPRIYLAGIITIAAFLAADPYFILDWKETRGAFLFLRYVYRDWNHGNSPAGYGWRWLLLRAMPAGFGIEFEVLLLAALVWAVVRPRPGAYALLAVVAACFLNLVGGHPQLEYRYLINPLMAMALLGGVLTADLLTLARSRLGARIGYLIGATGVLLFVPSFVRGVQFDRLLQRIDTRTIARQWMLNHILPGSPILLFSGDTYGKPKLPRGYNTVGIDVQSFQEAVKSAQWLVLDTFAPLPLWSKDPTEAQIAELNSKDTLELDVLSLKPGAKLPECDPNDAFYAPFNHFDSMLRPGPEIRIWKLTPR